MPIKITEGKDNIEIAWLCGGTGELPVQLATLNEWVQAKKSTLPSGKYHADIGYAARRGARGGGACLSTALMGDLAALEMVLEFSEYDLMSSQEL